MGFFKNQLLKVIKWEPKSPNTIVEKYTYDDRYAIMKGSQLIVKPAQAAIFIYKGSVADVFTEGEWKLEDGSLPFLTKIANWKYAFENPKDIEVYFVNLKRFTQNKWGTPNPIMMRDKDFGMIRISGHGEYSFHVMNPQLFMQECFGTIRSFSTDDIQEHLKSIVLSELTDLMGECSIPALDLAANYNELGETAKNNAAGKFQAIGLDIDQILIRNLKLPQNVEEAMDKRTTLGVFSDSMSNLAQYESIQAMKDVAKNPGAGASFATMGMGLGLGTRMAGQFSTGLDQASNKVSVKCAKCGALVDQNAKFCPECGEKMGEETVKCPKCGQDVPAGTKFCPNCGEKLTQVCKKCGTALVPGAKFCPNCGTKA